MIFEGRLSGLNCNVGYQLTLSEISRNRLGFDLKILNNQQVNRLFLRYASRPDERFYGFGEQFTYVNLKGKKVPIFAQEQGHLRGTQPYTFLLNRLAPGSAGTWETTYTAVPQYITSQSHSVFLENYELSIFNLADPNEVEIRIWSNEMRGQMIHGESPLDLIEEYTLYSGRMEALPEWVHSGAIIGIMGGSERTRMIWEMLKTHDTPVVAFWLQDWVGKRDTGLGIRMWWNWDLDRQTYPDWEELVSELNNEGIEVMGYINPWLSDASSKPGSQVNLFEIAKARGYLTTWENGQPAQVDSGGFTGTLIDLSNPDAREWIKGYLRETLLGLGMAGWMSDFGEALPNNAVLHSGESGWDYHNRYPEEWTKINREVLSEVGRWEDTVFFVRNATAKSPGYARLFWTGDQMVTWDENDGLKSSLTGILSGGFSGMSINHSDIGGLIGLKREAMGFKIDFRRDKELLIRWAEMNAFSPIYRTHEGNNPDLNHQFYSDESTFEAFSYFAKVFTSMVDYRKEVFGEAEAKGYPVMRHLVLHYPNDPVAADIKYQYLFGSEILVAPVTEPGATTWEVYLPEGEWRHIWNKRVYGSLEAGTYVSVDAPLGTPPVFIKKGSPWETTILGDIQSVGKKNFL
jgi:alpha-glucosidase